MAAAHNPNWSAQGVRQRMAEEAAQRAQDEADRLAIIAWNERMAGGGPAQPSPTIATAMRQGYRHLRVRCSACRQTAFLALADLDRTADTPVWKIEGALACQPCRKGRHRSPRAVLERLTIGETFGADPDVPIPAWHSLDELELLRHLSKTRQWMALADIDALRLLIQPAAVLVPALVARREIEHHAELKAVRITPVGLATIDR